MPTPTTPFEFALNHLQHLGWGVIIVFLVKATWEIAKWQAKAKEVYTQTTNHMPHELKRQTRLLVNLDKNIAVMSKGNTADMSGLSDNDEEA